MYNLTNNLGGMSLRSGFSEDHPIYITGITSNEVCFFQPMSEKFATLTVPSLPFAIKNGEMYRLNRGNITEYDKYELGRIKNRDQCGYDREQFIKYIMPSALLASRVRDYEQNAAVVTSLTPLVLRTSARDPYLTKLKLRTQTGESLDVRVDGKSGGDSQRACTLYCTPVAALPPSLTVGTRLEMVLDSDRVPVVTRVFHSFLDEGCSVEINWDAIDVLYGVRGHRVHKAPDLGVVPENAATKGLNPDQLEAVAKYIDGNSPILAVEAPPGSGKTTLAVAMVLSYSGPGTQLVLSTANEPMYNFVEKLQKIGLGGKRVTHLISPTREATRPSPYSIMSDEGGKHYERYSELCGDFRDAGRKVKRQIKRQIVKLRAKTIKSNTLEPNVLVATVDTILGKILSSERDAIQKALGDVRRIVIDEASQMTEVSILALILCFPKARFALIGDSRQLPPFKFESGDLVSELAARSALACVSASANAPVIKLRYLYRGSPSLIRHLSVFYDIKLISMKPESLVNPVECFTKDTKSRCVLFKIEGKARPRGTSQSNDTELQALIKIVGQLEKSGYDSRSIMIISYYEGQREAAKRALNGYDVHTVDSAQGREKEIVIVLTTRDSLPIKGGFLTCPYRCNVAFSRAQEALIVLAHPSILTAHPFSSVLSTEFFKHIDQI